MVSKSSNKRRYLKTSQLRLLQRKAFTCVVEAYLLFQSVTKHAQAINYAKYNEGDGPTFKPTQPIMFKMIDYEADVSNTVDQLCTNTEKKYMLNDVLTGNDDLTCISVANLKTHEKLGRAFIARQLYPVKVYFHGKV